MRYQGNDMELLDKAKAITGSDSETARRIGMKQGQICDVRNGRRDLTPYQAAKISEMVGQAWYEVALPQMAKKAKTYKERQFWLGKLESLKRASVMALFIGFLSLIPPHGDGNAEAGTSGTADPNVDYVKYWKIFLHKVLTFTKATFCAKKNPAEAGFFYARPG